MPSLRQAGQLLCLCLAPLLAACAEPPSKELSQAQGAIDTARAAGAAEYAAEEFTAATEMLARAHDAVAVRDYRAALSHALDSSERAQAAAASAVEGRVRARLAAEQRIAEVSAAVTHVRGRLTGAEARRVPAAVRQRAEQAVESAAAALASTRAAVEAGDLSATAGLAQHRTALTAALTDLESAVAANRPRGRR
jgi:hypothetical protein